MKETIYVEKGNRIVFHTSIDEADKWYTVVDDNLKLTDLAIDAMNSFLIKKEGITVDLCTQIIVEELNGAKHILDCKTLYEED